MWDEAPPTWAGPAKEHDRRHNPAPLEHHCSRGHGPHRQTAGGCKDLPRAGGE